MVRWVVWHSVCAHLHKFLFQRLFVSVIDVDGPSMVVLKRCTDYHVVEPVEVEVWHRCDGRAEPSAARLILVAAAGGVGRAAGLIDGLESELVLELPILARGGRKNELRQRSIKIEIVIIQRCVSAIYSIVNFGKNMTQAPLLLELKS